MNALSISNYAFVKQIARGSFAQIYLAIDKKTCQHVAVKKIRLTNHVAPKYVQSEVDLMQKASTHQNITSLHGVFLTRNHIYLVMDYCPSGDLSSLIRHRALSEQECKKYAKQLIAGLKHLQQLKIVHRDLKPSNFLLFGDQLKITDFGFSKLLGPEELAQTLCGSPLYMAPEILNHQAYNNKSDLWSLGVVLYQMIHQVVPFRANSLSELVEMINQFNGQLFEKHSEQLSAEYVDLLNGLLQKDPVKRISWEQLFAHAWFKEAKAVIPQEIAFKPEPYQPPDLYLAEPSHLMISDYFSSGLTEIDATKTVAVKTVKKVNSKGVLKTISGSLQALGDSLKFSWKVLFTEPVISGSR